MKVKAKNAQTASSLEDIPNVGKKVVDDLRAIGIEYPHQLKNKDGIDLYLQLNKVTNMRHDPCMADVFLAAVDFMNGKEPQDWWKFTQKRKKLFLARGIV